VRACHGRHTHARTHALTRARAHTHTTQTRRTINAHGCLRDRRRSTCAPVRSRIGSPSACCAHSGRRSASSTSSLRIRPHARAPSPPRPAPLALLFLHAQAHAQVCTYTRTARMFRIDGRSSPVRCAVRCADAPTRVCLCAARSTGCSLRGCTRSSSSSPSRATPCS